ncbi:hypothetical protein [Campylobacter troglodytis]|uniref:hypothetical protein n=1 Tax=Campylobacter troglodytis TaxID=654363 RepID=UPI0011570E39|nr:hypothetical protein [Campylobacter troglodytis]TQR48066.1 hypothetical protein DMC01_13190 [Campylobacter troglodytis]
MKYFLPCLSSPPFARIDLEAKNIADLCKISRACVNRILWEIHILTLKECEKLAKRSFFRK